MTPKADDILEGDFWPERVPVLTVEPVGSRLRVQAVGLRSQPPRFYPQVLSADDLARVQVITETGQDFSGRGEAFSWGSKPIGFDIPTNSTPSMPSTFRK